MTSICSIFAGKGGKNRRRGKNDAYEEKREIIYKGDLQGMHIALCEQLHGAIINVINFVLHF